MAKKTNVSEDVTTVQQEAELGETVQEKETEQGLVEIELFKDNKDYKDGVFVAINGKSMVIQRGKKVKVPESYAKVLAQSKKQDDATADLIASKQDEYLEEAAKRK